MKSAAGTRANDVLGQLGPELSAKPRFTAQNLVLYTWKNRGSGEQNNYLFSPTG